jgi:hypothetical protein
MGRPVLPNQPPRMYRNEQSSPSQAWLDATEGRSMGGIGSTRWDMSVPRTATDGLPRLDVCALARAGALESGTSATVSWDDRATIMTDVPPGAPDAIALRYAVRTGIRQMREVEEYGAVTRAPCHFGGSRAWLGCSRCGSRGAGL